MPIRAFKLKKPENTKAIANAYILNKNVEELLPEKINNIHPTGSIVENNNSGRDRTPSIIKVLIVIAFFCVINFLKFSPERMMFQITKMGDLTQNDDVDASGLFPRFFLRNVLREPVLEKDIAFLWLSYESPENDIVASIFTNCYQMKLSHDASKINLKMYNWANGIMSTDFQSIVRQFNHHNHGRMFAFFKHPFYIYLDQLEESNIAFTNRLTRMILNQPEGDITLRGLGTAKKIIRENCVVGLLDENLIESIERISSYFGWGTYTENCPQDSRNLISHPNSTLMDPNTPIWSKFIEHNHFDMELYEYARSVFRGQAQTIISREKQTQKLKNRF